MTTIKTLQLGDVAEFVRGVTFKPEDVVEENPPNTVWCMRTKNVQKKLDTSDVWSISPNHVKRDNQYLREGDILVSSANSWNLIGKCSWVPNLSQATTFGGFVSALRAYHQYVTPRYLYHWFSSGKTQFILRNFGRQTTNISNLDIKRCLKMPVLVPEIETQKRIAALLDEVEFAREKRRRSIELLDELTQSVFLDMFGDPTTNGLTWKRKKLSNIVEGIDSGKSPKCHSTPAREGKWGVLKLGAVTKGEYLSGENKELPDSELFNPRHEIQPGDLLFTRKNTPELVAACALVHETPPKLLMPDLIFRINLKNDSPVTKNYLHRLLSHPTKRRNIQGLAGGSAASMVNISKSRLLEIPIEIPPLSLQQEFDERILSIQSLKKSHQAHLTLLDELFASVQQRAFDGTLWDDGDVTT